jgi:hypothetical protein
MSKHLNFAAFDVETANGNERLSLILKYSGELIFKKLASPGQRRRRAGR